MFSKTIFLIFRIYQYDKVFDFCLVSMSVLGLGSRQVLAGWIFHGPIVIVSEISNFVSKYFKIFWPYLGSRFINRSSGRIFNWAWLTWTWKTTYAFWYISCYNYCFLSCIRFHTKNVALYSWSCNKSVQLFLVMFEILQFCILVFEDILQGHLTDKMKIF